MGTFISFGFNPDGSFSQTNNEGIITFEYDDCGRNDICYNRVRIVDYDRDFFCGCDFYDQLIVREERNYAAKSPIKFTLYGKHFSGIGFDVTFEGCCVHVTSTVIDSLYTITIAMLLVVIAYRKDKYCGILDTSNATTIYRNLITRSQFCKEYNDYARVDSIEWQRSSIYCLHTMVSERERISNIDIKGYNGSHLIKFITYLKRLYNKQLETYANDSHWSGNELSWLKFGDEG